MNTSELLHGMHAKVKPPLLPGFVLNKPKENYHLPHCWNHLRGTNIIIENDRSASAIDCDKMVQETKLYPTPTNVPDWIAYDRKILCFFGYFREDLQETYTATYQIRKVKILYHLEDGTIQVVEPRIDNSGISQGSIVSKQRVPKSKVGQTDFLSVLDLNVQREVKIFDRIYTLTDCDEFTRKFLNGAGISVPDPIEIPEDPTKEVRQRQKDEAKPKKSKMCHEDAKKLEKFLKYGTSCLKFSAYWDDRHSVNGDVHDLNLYFYLCDETVQITEIDDQKKSSILFKRQKLPKNSNDPLLAGQKSNFTVLNVLGRDVMKARYVQDRLNLGRPSTEFYKDEDFGIGETIDVFGRNVVLIDCDNFTRNYYYEKFGIEEFVPMEKPNRKSFQKPVTEFELPPYNGFGSMADSEANCLSLMPKPPKHDMNKFLTLDRCNLRFRAKMISDIIENCERNFVITYHLSSDEISIYEIGGRNSGFSSGDFQKRTKVDLSILNPSRDFYIGGRIRWMGFEFKVIDADEFTLKHMESHPFEYPMANISSILSKIKLAIKPIYKNFVAKYLGNVSVSPSTSQGQKLYICFNTMKNALIDLLGNTITDHEIITFLRFYSVPTSANVVKSHDRNAMQTLIETEFSRHVWNDMEVVRQLLYDLDPHYVNGYLSKQKLRSIILGCRVPIKNDMMDGLFAVLKQNAVGEIEVDDFLHFIESCKHRPIGFHSKTLHFPIEKDNRSSFGRQRLINWSKFIEDLGLEKELEEGIE